MKACLTGSRVYGTPRPDSDLDCVILVEDEDDWDLLSHNQDFTQKKMPSFDMSNTQGGYCGRSLRYGKMNVSAVLRDKRVYEAWEKGTRFLKAIKPVTKEQACLVLESMFNVAQQNGTSTSTRVDTSPQISTPFGVPLNLTSLIV